MVTRRTRKRPLERRFDSCSKLGGPFLSLGMPYAHGGPRNAWMVILLFVASYSREKERESSIYLGLLYFIFGQNGKHLAHRRRPSILHRSFPSSFVLVELFLLFLASLHSPLRVGSFSTFLSLHFLSPFLLLSRRIPLSSVFLSTRSTRCSNCCRSLTALRDGAAICRNYCFSFGVLLFFFLISIVFIGRIRGKY